MRGAQLGQVDRETSHVPVSLTRWNPGASQPYSKIDLIGPTSELCGRLLHAFVPIDCDK